LQISKNTLVSDSLNYPNESTNTYLLKTPFNYATTHTFCAAQKSRVWTSVNGKYFSWFSSGLGPGWQSGGAAKLGVM